MKPPVQTSGSDYKVSKNNSLMNHSEDPIQYFFDIKHNKRDLRKLITYSTAHTLREKGTPTKEISKLISISKSTLEKWFSSKNIPPEVRLYNTFQKLSLPRENHKWLSLNKTRGGLLIGPWIQVPTKVNSFEEIKFVLDQINPLADYMNLAKIFEIEENDLNVLKYNCFYYLLGIMLGDGAMCKGNSRRSITRRITLTMTKKHKTNKRVCQYTQLCSSLIGLRMKRTKDDKPNHKSKHYFYRWQGQCSQFVNWISKVCFGLKDDEVKTYTPIKADWLIKSPKELQISFLQGVADSDGYIDLGTKQAGIISKSSIKTIEKILDNLEVHNCRKYSHKDALAISMINYKDAFNLPIFNPHIISYRFTLLQKMNFAKTQKHHLPKNLSEEVNKTLRNGASSIDIVKMMLFKHNICIRESSIQKRIRRLKQIGELNDSMSCG